MALHVPHGFEGQSEYGAVRAPRQADAEPWLFDEVRGVSGGLHDPRDKPPPHVLHSAHIGTGKNLMAERTRVICVGEVMVELSRNAEGRYGRAYRRRHVQHRRSIWRAPASTHVYATALGDDPYTDELLALADGRERATAI